MDAVHDEVQQLRFALEGARSRIEELSANGRRIVSLEQQIQSIRQELERYQAATGAAEAIVGEARDKRRKILDDSARLAKEVAERAREIGRTAEADADLLRAAALEEGRLRSTELLEQTRREAHEIRMAARRESEQLMAETEHKARTMLDQMTRLRQSGPTEPTELTVAINEPVQSNPQAFRARRPSQLPKLGIEEADIWAKASRPTR